MAKLKSENLKRVRLPLPQSEEDKKRIQVTISANPNEIKHLVRCLELQPMLGIFYETKTINQFNEGITITYTGKPNDLSKILLAIMAQSYKFSK